MKTLPLEPGPQGLRRLRRRLEQPEQVPDVAGSELPACDAARLFWSERAWSEYAAVPATSQLALALVRDQTSMDALGALGKITSDEVYHSELARDLAIGFGGYEETIPAELPYQPAILAEMEGQDAASWLVSIVISETISAALMQARLQKTRHPLVRKVLDRVLRDERVHAGTGWLLARSVIPELDRDERDELAEQALEVFDAIGQTFATAGLPSLARAQARRIRTETADRGLGAIPPDEADALVLKVITEIVTPRLRQLGVDVRD